MISSEGEPAIVVSDLSHRFKKHKALSRVSFSVEPGTIHGFVGPNGAGKTTTLKIVSTLIKPQAGSVTVLGKCVAQQAKAVRHHLGFMPDYFSLYKQMTVFEYLDFFAAAYGLSFNRRNAIIKDVLELTDMAGRQDDLIKGLSRGMQQRVSLARVLVHDPEILLLDEPASGLDPRARIELMEIIKELKSMGKTVFISSHILSELADLCDSVTILDQGTVKFSGAMADLLSHENPDGANYVLHLAETSPAAEAAVLEQDGIIKFSQVDHIPRYSLVFLPEVITANEILQAVITAGGKVTSLVEDRKHLNEAFMDLTTPGVRT